MNQIAAAGAAVSVPVVWSFLGFDIQAGPAIVGVCAVIITRMIVTLNSTGRRKVVLDVFVTALCALVTVLWIQAQTLDLLKAGITGIGVASAGLGIIGIAKSTLLGPLRAGIRAAIHAADTTEDPRP